MTTLQCRERAEIDRAAWDGLVDASNEAWLWHRADSVDAQLTWPLRRDVSFGVYDDRGSLCALMPVWCSRERLCGTSFRRYMRSAGPAYAAGLAPKQRRQVEEHLAEHIADILAREDAEHLGVTVSPLAPYVRAPNPPGGNPLLPLGFTNTSLETWVVDLQPSVAEIRGRYAHGVRQILRQADKTPCTLRAASGSRDLETYYGLHRDTFSRTGAAIEPFDYYRVIFERFVPAGFARVLFFERQGRVIAGHNTAIYKDAAHYWAGASIAEPEGSNHTLFDAQILAAREGGCTVYETGLACHDPKNTKAWGMSRYKRSFGAELMPQFAGRLRSDRVKHRLYRAAREALGRAS